MTKYQRVIFLECELVVVGHDLLLDFFSIIISFSQLYINGNNYSYGVSFCTFGG